MRDARKEEREVERREEWTAANGEMKGRGGEEEGVGRVGWEREESG